MKDRGNIFAEACVAFLVLALIYFGGYAAFGRYREIDKNKFYVSFNSKWQSNFFRPATRLDGFLRGCSTGDAGYIDEEGTHVFP